jgi:pSer/pThr/pTyr-binding forkhead associated (FHA) protein
VNNPNSKIELTSTLHLGVRAVVDASLDSAITAYLSSVSAEDRSAVESAINGENSRAMIVIHRGPSKGSRFLVAQESTEIGRAAESDVFLDDVTVSRCHARITSKDGIFTLSDLGSLNGTYVNNISESSVVLKMGDEIQIGKFHALFLCSKNNN